MDGPTFAFGGSVGCHNFLKKDLVLAVYPSHFLVGEGHILPSMCASRGAKVPGVR